MGIAALAVTKLVLAQGFSFTIASPVASQDYRFKSAAFVFRTEGCSDPAKAQITATAEGIVKGEHKTVALTATPGNKPGVYGITQTWAPEGKWVVALKGSCDRSSAGAIVPIGPQGLLRDSAKFFAHPPSASDIETALKALESGGGK
jgi:hypothetical protein